MGDMIVAVIKNEFDTSLRIDLEPVPLTYMLDPEDELSVVAKVSGSSSDAISGACVALRFGATDEGEKYIAVWPDCYDLSLVHNGQDVFDN